MKRPLRRAGRGLLVLFFLGIIVLGLVHLPSGMKYWNNDWLERLSGGPGGPGPQDFAAAMRAQSDAEPWLLQLPGVTGVGIGRTPRGFPMIRIFVEPSATAAQLASLPERLASFLVGVETAGPFFIGPPPPAYAGEANEVRAPAASEAPAPTSRFNRPVPMGVSTGHTRTTAGTIGAVVTDGSSTYALSNWHVFVPGGEAEIGDALLQPGPVDGGANPADRIGTLAAFVPVTLSPLADNRMDAAIALTSEVTPTTPPDGYGSPRSEPVEATPGLEVQKYGRTTRLTTGHIDTINATINVGYRSGRNQVARFRGQIIVCCNFSQGGDSGSLIVTRSTEEGGASSASDRRPVALLFAGDGRFTIANPIGPVLDRFGVTVVGERD